MLIFRASSRASPLPPLTELSCRTAIKCGSGLARDGAISITHNHLIRALLNLDQKLVFIVLRVYTRIMLSTDCLCISLRRAARGVSRHYDGALDGFGINVAQYSLLCNLQRLDQPSISELAEAMGLDRSTLGRNLRVLEGEGLVALAEGEDMRNRIVRLTETGAQRLAAALPAWEAAQQRLIDRLGAEKRETLLRLLDELA